MEARLFLVTIALAGAFCGAVAAARLAALQLRRRRIASVGQENDASLVASIVAWRMRNGFKFLARPVEVILRVDPIRNLVHEAVGILNRHEIATTENSLASIVLFVAMAAGLAAGVLTGSVVAVVAVPLCFVMGVVMAIGNARDRRIEAARDSVPEALESMSACFGTGLTLLQTMRQVSHDVDGPLSEAFGRSAHILETGGGAKEALRELRTGDYAAELAFVVVALDVQHQSGGAMRQVLDAAADTVKGELALRRSLRVQTAQARLSARVVAIMPFILVAAFSLISPDFLSPFFESVFGYALLGIAIAMQLAGIVLVRRALAVDGVS